MKDTVPDTLKVAEAELREEVEAQRLQDEARFSPPASCCQYGCDGSGWRDLSEFETSPSSVEADARPSSPPDIFLGGRWLTPCECNAISAYTCVGAKCYPPTYEPPATETYYAILNPAHPLGPTILMENDKGAYGANEIVEACSDAVTAMHERHNDSLFIVKLQVITRVADEEIVARLATCSGPSPSSGGATWRSTPAWPSSRWMPSYARAGSPMPTC